MADGKVVFRHVGVGPQAAALSLLALVEQPVVVAFVDDMAFGRIQGSRASAAVE